MPAKPSRQSRKKLTQNQPMIVPIYHTFISSSDSDAHHHSLQAILTKLEATYADNKGSIFRNMLVLILQTCGLDDMVSSIDFDNVCESLEEMLDGLTEVNSRQATPLIIDPKSTGQCSGRLRQFLASVISDDFPFMKDLLLLEQFRSWLVLLTKSKHRAIRSSSVQFMSLLLERQAQYYSFLLNSHSSRKAQQVANNIQKYFETIIISRLKDVDSTIRDCVFVMLKNTMPLLEDDTIGHDLLKRLLLPLLAEHNPKIVEGCLGLLLHLLQEDCNAKMSLLLTQFCCEHCKVFEEISMIPNRNGVLSLRVLSVLTKGTTRKYKFTPGLIGKVFQLYSHQQFHSGLQLAVDLFYFTIFSTHEQLLANSNIVVMQIINLLNFIDSRRLITTILDKFFHSTVVPNQKIFTPQTMLVLLLKGSYIHDGHSVQLQSKQLAILLQIITQYTRYISNRLSRVKASNTDQTVTDSLQQLADNYNTIVLTNCKQLLYNKIINGSHTQLTHLYLQLFSCLFLPILGNFAVYIDLIIEKIVQIFQNDTSVDTVKEAVKVFHHLQSHDVALLVKHVNIAEGCNETTIAQVSAILGQYDIPELSTSAVLSTLLSQYPKCHDDKSKMEVFMISYLMHQWSFKHFLTVLTTQSHKSYLEVRDLTISFLFDAIRWDDERSLVKLGAFNVLCMVLKLICNNKIVDMSAVYLELKEEQMAYIDKFVSNQIGVISYNSFEDSNGSFSMDLSRMFNTLSFESQQTKQQILRLLFQLFTQCNRLVYNQQSAALILGCFIREQGDNYDGDLTMVNKSVNESLRSVNNKSTLDNRNSNLFARQKYASRLFNFMILDQGKSDNHNRFIFWRLVKQMLALLPNKSLIMEKCLSRLLITYFKRMRKQNQKAFLNKLILFIVGQIDHVVQYKSFQKLFWLKLMIQKTKRRYAKEVMHRLMDFAKEKFQGIEDPDNFGQDFISYLAKVSKGGKQKIEKDEDEDELEEEQDAAEDDEEKQDERTSQQKYQRYTRSVSKRMGRV